MKTTITILAVIGITLAALAVIIGFAVLLGKSLAKLGRCSVNQDISNLKKSDNETSIGSK